MVIFSEVRPRAKGRRLHDFRLVWLSVLFVLCAVFTAAAFAEVQYVYDENGRLVLVVAQTGASAQYSYDAAGNIIALAQVPASSLSIVEFTPNADPRRRDGHPWGNAEGVQRVHHPPKS
ncbi:RHS repeat domain-containing protein [Variovorax sp. V116]|uniref:RHS repeat domain-containing protein n=1 Tax=Variovorax sp. V116 TaxID=3065953 RepID=UPI0034E898C3